jgi:hypothetical protein
MPSTRVTWNDAMTYGDCKPITEAGWYADKLISMCPFVEDVYEVNTSSLKIQMENARKESELL